MTPKRKRPCKDCAQAHWCDKCGQHIEQPTKMGLCERFALAVDILFAGEDALKGLAGELKMPGDSEFEAWVLSVRDWHQKVSAKQGWDAAIEEVRKMNLERRNG
jgi:hypothetical protein